MKFNHTQNVFFEGK